MKNLTNRELHFLKQCLMTGIPKWTREDLEAHKKLCDKVDWFILKDHKKCESCGETKLCEEHHLIPKSIGGMEKDGFRTLCVKCHDILHNKLLLECFHYVPKEIKGSCKRHLKSFGKRFKQ